MSVSLVSIYPDNDFFEKPHSYLRLCTKCLFLTLSFSNVLPLSYDSETKSMSQVSWSRNGSSEQTMCLKGQPEYCHPSHAMLAEDLQADDSVSQV